MNILIPKTDEEIVLERMKQEERSTHWLHRKTEMSQSYIYKVLIGPAKDKKPITDEFRQLIKQVWPDILFNHELDFPHEKLEKDKLDAKNLFND